MNVAIAPDDIISPEPIRTSVARLAAGFRRMEELSDELATLDCVNQDVWRTHASIRRDAANAVLQTAFSLKEREAAAMRPSELRERLEPAPDSGDSDLWAKKLLRWADRFGRDFLGLSGARAPAAKKNVATVPLQEP